MDILPKIWEINNREIIFKGIETTDVTSIYLASDTDNTIVQILLEG